MPATTKHMQRTIPFLYIITISFKLINESVGQWLPLDFTLTVQQLHTMRPHVRKSALAVAAEYKIGPDKTVFDAPFSPTPSK